MSDLTDSEATVVAASLLAEVERLRKENEALTNRILSDEDEREDPDVFVEMEPVESYGVMMISKAGLQRLHRIEEAAWHLLREGAPIQVDMKDWDALRVALEMQ